MKKTTFLSLLFVCWIYNLNAQSSSPEIISSAGETFQGTTTQIEWTLGELAIMTTQNSSLQITQGFHQPTYMITNVNELPQQIGTIEVYPNPTADRINMKLNFDQNRNVLIQLLDLNGKVIWTTENNGSQLEQVKNISDLSNGTYLLNFLIDQNKYSQTFKIQKLN